MLSAVLNRVFATPLRGGEFGFLHHRVVAIRVQDLDIEYRICLDGRTFLPGPRTRTNDLTISGSLHDFMALATRQEDPDTLFFQRRLLLEGDIELGLELKNLLDATDPETLGVPMTLQYLLQGGLGVYRRLFG